MQRTAKETQRVRATKVRDGNRKIAEIARCRCTKINVCTAMDAAFLLTIGSFPLTVELLYLQLTILFFTTVGAFLLTALAFLLTDGALLLTVGKCV